MHKKRLRHWGVIAIVLIMISTACSGQDSTTGDPVTTTTPGAERVVEISMTEFAFTPSIVKVEAGETVKFVVTNDGVVDHEFEVATQDVIHEHTQGGHEGHNGNMSKQKSGLKLKLMAGERGELTVTFDEAQELLFACLLPGHYEAGMVGEFDFGKDANHEEHEDETDHGDSDEEDHDDSDEEDEGHDH